MAAKYPEIFIRPAQAQLDFTRPDSGAHVSSEGWIRLRDIFQGASFKIEPGLQKTMNRGQQRTLSEKISVGMKLAFIDKARYERARSWINKPLDMIWFDPEDVTGMITGLWEISLKVKGEMEGGDGYIVTLEAEHEVRTGAGLTMENAPQYRLLTFHIYDSKTQLGLQAEIVMKGGVLTTDNMGNGWILADYDYVGMEPVEVIAVGLEHPRQRIDLAKALRSLGESFINYGIEDIEYPGPNPPPPPSP